LHNRPPFARALAVVAVGGIVVSGMKARSWVSPSESRGFASPIDNTILFDPSGNPVGGAGLIGATSLDAREIQFALKVIW